jgi:DNA-binding NarL/FixJ family response regulator
VGGFTVTLTARTGRDLLADMDPDDLPDVVVLDKSTTANRREGLETAASIRKAYPDVGIVLVSMDLTVNDANELMALPGDALGVISKGAITDHSNLVSMITCVGMGGSLVEPSMRIQMRAHTQEFALLDLLAPREIETLGFMAEGLPNSEIAVRMGLHPTKGVRTVETYCSNIYSKLQLDSGRQNRIKAGNLWLASGRKPTSA